MKRLAALALTGAAVLPPVAAGPVTAQQGSPSRVVLVSMPSWIEAGAAINFDLRIEPPGPDLELAVSIHGAVRSRTEFDVSVTGVLPAPLGSAVVDVDDLDEPPAGTHRLTVDLGTAGGGDGALDLPSIPVTQAGVYPVQLELRVKGSESPVDTLLTHVVVIEEDRPPTRLSVAWVWPVAVRAPIAVDGEPSIAMDEALGPAGRLAQLADALEAGPEVPITLAPAPATVDAWALRSTAEDEAGEQALPASASAAADRLDALRSAATTPSRQVVAGPYARVDLRSLVAAGLVDEVREQLARGSDVLRDALGIRPDPRTFIARALDADTLGPLREAGVDRLVIESDALAPVFENLTPARPFDVRSAGRSFLAAAADPGLSALLETEVDEEADGEPRQEALTSAALAQRFLAGLAVVALEAPGEERGVVVAPSRAWEPTASMLVSVMTGLVDHPALRAVTLDAFFARVEPAAGESAVRSLQPGEPGPLGLGAGDVRDARERIGALARMTSDDAPVVAASERLLLLAEGAGPDDRPGAAEFLGGIGAHLASVTGAVRLPSEPSVTLTAQRGRIPLSFVNESAAPIRVRVLLDSDKLLFPDGNAQELVLPPRSSTAEFTVEARTSGSFPMTVEVTSPDGVLAVGTVTMTVRSTAVSGVALAITIGAGVFLVGWWANHIRRSRRRRRSPDTPEDDPDPAPGAGGPPEPGSSA